jgi:hypothetical protein
MAECGNPKPGIFINNIPSMAMPRRLSRITILSPWLAGAANVDTDLSLMLVGLVTEAVLVVLCLIDVL